VRPARRASCFPVPSATGAAEAAPSSSASATKTEWRGKNIVDRAAGDAKGANVKGVKVKRVKVKRVNVEGVNTKALRNQTQVPAAATSL